MLPLRLHHRSWKPFCEMSSTLIRSLCSFHSVLDKLLLERPHRQKLRQLHETFEQHRAALERMLNARIAKRTQSRLTNLDTATAEIMARIVRTEGTIARVAVEQEEATDFIKQHGADEIRKVRSFHPITLVGIVSTAI